MELSMTISRGVARFEVSDGEVESTVTISTSDEPSAVVRKLRRVVELVEGGLPPVGQGGGKVVTLPSSVPLPAATEAPALGDKQIGNGWEMIKGGE